MSMENATHSWILSKDKDSSKAIFRDLKKILRPDQISCQVPERLNYGRDSSSQSILWVRRGLIKYPPDFIVWPENTQEVSALVTYANSKKIPIVPFGGGSGVCGGTWALQGGIAVDLKKLDKIIRLNTREMRVLAQAGINGELFERELQRRGLTLGHFPSSIYSATLGGYLACRSAGQFSSKYGKIEDMVETMEVVLPTGEVVQVGDVTNHPGHLDLKELFLGSEGTLGIITQAKLKIHPKFNYQKFLGFSFASLGNGLQAIREIMQCGLTPSVVRLYDELDSILATSYKEESSSRDLLGVVRTLGSVVSWTKDVSLKNILKKASWLKKGLNYLPVRCLLILGFEDEESLAKAQIELASNICCQFKAKDMGEKPGLYWLAHRYSVSYKMAPVFDKGMFADTMEVATTWNNLENLYREIREAVGHYALVLAHFSHAYPEGCSIYFTFVGYHSDARELEALYERIWDVALKTCVQAGGTISHHHGIGVLKAAYMRKEWRDSYDWLLGVKKKLDPNNICNPGKLGFS